MSNRELVKWQPFSAVVTGNVMINEVLNKKNKIAMPVLSEDQKNELQEKMLISYNNQDIINIRYYKAGKVLEVKGIISNIDSIGHKLVINGQISVFFSQIIAFF